MAKKVKEKGKIIMIVACDKNKLIGSNGKLPWNIKEEMAHFKNTTTGNIVIMGYNTYAGLNRPVLPNRINVVITNSPQIRKDEFNQKYPDAKEKPEFLSSLDESLRYSRWVYPHTDIYIIGGLSIYKQAIEASIPDKILLSEINEAYIGDMFLPNIPDIYIPDLNSPVYDKFKIIAYNKSINTM